MVAAAVLAGGLSLPGRAAAASQPNIIYVMADDLGYGDLGCYGQEEIKTPNIDQLASEGMRFTDHYSGQTVCRPSRLSLRTGYHTGHTPIGSNADYDLAPNDRITAKLLGEAGYAVGGVGKWALGEADTTGAPHKQGFDLWYGYLNQVAAHNYWPEFLWRNGQKIALENEVDYADSGYAKGLSGVATKKVDYSHDLMTREALRFIRKHQNGPFFFQAHYTIPHANNQAGRHGMEVPEYGEYKDKEWPETEKGFAAMVTRLDRDVGRIVDLLQELGIAKETLVIFTSDNGPHHEGGHDHAFFNSNGPLRGYKRDLYEGGIRVPMIAWWPGKIEAGSVSDHVSAFWDVMPTACEVAGLEPPGDIDGISFLPELLGKPQRKHHHLYWKFKGKIALRQGKWKLVRNGNEEAYELYNLKKDPGERKNLASHRPELLRQMKATARSIRKEGSADLGF